MSKSTAIHGQLSSRLSVWANARSPKLVIKFEGQATTPTSGTYLREWLMLATPRAAGIGVAAQNYQDGVYQVDVVTDAAGWGIAYGVADEISTLFNRGRHMTGTGLRVTVKSTAAGPAFREEGRYILPVSINFFAYIDV